MGQDDLLVRDDIFNALAKGKLDTYSFELSEFEEKRALKFLSDELKEDYKNLNSGEVLKTRHECFDVPDSFPEDYSETILETPEGGYLLMGIRHLGGDKNLAFIRITSSQKIKSPETFQYILNLLKLKFNVFSPQYLSFDSPEPLKTDFTGHLTIVGRKEAYKNLPAFEGDSHLQLKKEEDLTHYEWLKTGYDEFHRENPELKKKVLLCCKEDLESSLKDGLLYSASLDGQLVGLIAGERSSFLGLPGLYFNEIFLAKEFRGFGLGKSLQKEFVLIEASEHDIIWGTIDAQNEASIYTAKANGRQVVSYECFLKI